MTWQEDLAARLLQLRRQKGISQEELAEAAGVSRQAVSKWESAQSQPETEKLLAISAYFDVSLDWLLKGEEPPAVAKATERKPDGRLALSIASVMIWCGLLIGWTMWYSWQNSFGAVVSLIIMIVALAAFKYEAGELPGGVRDSLKARFWLINICPVSMLLVSVGFSILFSLQSGRFLLLSPVLSRYLMIDAYAVGGAGCPFLVLGVWLIICLAVMVQAWHKLK